MEYKRIFLPYETKTQYNGDIAAKVPCDDKNTLKREKEIETLIKKGYTIVSTAPVTASYILGKLGTVTFTTGIEVFLIKDS